jgi:DNA-binding transcriptional ArsR family regulator
MAKRDPEVVDRDQQILNRLAQIEHKVDSLEQTHAFALRADEARHFESVEKIFNDSIRKAQVYLASDGKRSVNQIAVHLKMKQPNISRALSVLQSEGLVEIVDQHGGNSYWGKKPLDRTLRISKFLMEKYNLAANGLEKPAKKKK